ncbi:MAG: hypothetical protein KGO49_01130 [Gammaproteobacteria bacterium]|nr:hypothetical protein [Gammaproteobacteria bacterium]
MNYLKLTLLTFCFTASSLVIAGNIDQQHSDDGACGLASVWLTFNNFIDSECPSSSERSNIADSLRQTFKDKCSNTAIQFWDKQKTERLSRKFESEAVAAHLTTEQYCEKTNSTFIQLGATAEHHVKYGSHKLVNSTLQ